jgi:polysaccharide pyruvyl transferase WcaK-like protein
MLRVAIIGWNGRFNVGDDAMTCSLIKLINEQNKKVHFFIFSDKRGVSVFERCNTNGVFSMVPYFNTLNNIRGFSNIINKLYLFPKYLKNIDILIFGGGAIFKNYKICNAKIKLIDYVSKHNPNVLIHGYSLTIGPYNSKNYNYCKKLISKFDTLSVRDSRSESIVRSFKGEDNCYRTYDFAMILPDLLKINRSTPDNDTIGISLRSGHVDNKLIESIGSIVSSCIINDKNLNVYIFVFCMYDKQNDLFDANNLLEKIKKTLAAKGRYIDRIKIINYNMDLSNFLESVERCSIIVAERLHAAVLGCSLNKPLIMLSYSQKCIDFAIEINLDRKYIFDINRIDYIEFSNSFNNCMRLYKNGRVNWHVDKNIVNNNIRQTFSRQFSL